MATDQAKMIEKSFQLPDLGEGLTDAEILRWHVAVGDPVILNQVIAEVETAKAAVELPSPYAGRVRKLLVDAGTTVAVGTPIITFAVESATGDQAAREQADQERQVPQEREAGEREAGEREPEEQGPEEQAGGERVPVLVGYGATAGTSSRRGTRPRPVPASPSFSPIPTRPLAKPLVRKLARELEVDLAQVPGTGTGGIVTRQDLLEHCARRNTGTPATASTEPSIRPSTEREERIPIHGVRRATAAAMVASAFTAPHVTEFITVDVTATMDLIRRLRGSAFLDGVKLTILPFVATALIQALRHAPGLNSCWDEAAQEIVIKRYVNLGIATATPRGLLVPNLKDAERLGLIELARSLNNLTETARAGRCTPTDLTGGTISITNVGVFGVDCGTPILNPGEAAILCLGAVREQPWVHKGQLAVRWVTTLSLSFDHRLVDGELGSRFLADIASTLTTG